VSEPLISVDRVNHFFGSGALRKQILFDVTTEVPAGEIVILTGPSGSGKTTLITLIGALRTTQEGSLRVFGQELRGASQRTLVGVRRRIGLIFQQHNLLDALTTAQNVAMGLRRDLGLPARAARARAIEVLASVGLEAEAHRHPDQLSGGQKQRVAIARALAGRPRIILADEPTASLDREAGREVVDRIRELAKQEGCAVVLVTHDDRIFDIADRIVHLEEGRLSSLTDVVRSNTRLLLRTLGKSAPGADVERRVEGMSPAEFTAFLGQVTAEATQALDAMRLGEDGAFAILLEQVLHAIVIKVGALLEAERASLLLADEARGELWSLVAQEQGGQPQGGQPLEIRIPATTGISGRVYRTGAPLNLAEAYESPDFNPEVDRRTGYRTRSILCVPVCEDRQRPFGVMTLLNKRGGTPFDARDEQRLGEFAASVGLVLATWHQAHRTRRSAEQDALPADAAGVP
jgi:putative ABC transport system ATP-binding protein